MHFLQLIYLFLPAILGGILNMVFMKLKILQFLKKPIDGGKKLSDGKRIFGDNKTWKGFFGMILCAVLATVFQYILAEYFHVGTGLLLVDFQHISVLLLGLAFGLGYAVAELPNSFLKRRLNIAPGTNSYRGWGVFFMFIDQVDSIIGCTIAVMPFVDLNLSDMVFIVLFGAFLHYSINILLYFAGLKKQMG